MTCPSTTDVVRRFGSVTLADDLPLTPMPLAQIPEQRSTGQDTITFRLLGGLGFCPNGSPVEIRGTIQRTLLATLLTVGSHPVPMGALVEELWGEHPPATAENALQAHISRLRRKLQGVAGAGSVRLVGLPSGYRLLVPAEDVDALLFLRTLGEVRGRQATDADDGAIVRLRAALALWFGPVFGGLVGGPICQAAVARFEAARSVAAETLFDLELRQGRHTEIIPELSGLVESQALNERFCEQLMVALYRSGRQIEALDAYRRMRLRLDTELGVAPSPTLRTYERAILAHDPALRIGADHAALRGEAA
ncbi:MAG TPA: AfsR/SARP family transcriptional regulator [Pseudonocardiaceae bacterium]|jgi:DNA-binding SARP family transcriptional activator